MSKHRSEPPPVRESQAPGGEPEIDRVKLWQAWTRNAETQRAVLSRSTIVGVLAVLATLLQVGVAWFVLARVDAVAEAAGREIAEMKGMLAQALAASAVVNKIEIEEKEAEVAQIDELLDLGAESTKPEPPPPPGTVRYAPDAARSIVRASEEAARAAASPAAGAKRATLAKRKAAREQIEQVIMQLGAESAPEVTEQAEAK